MRPLPEHTISRKQIEGKIFRRQLLFAKPLETLIHGTEIGVDRLFKEALKAVNDEVHRLEIVDVDAGPHATIQVELEMMGRRIVNAILGFTKGGAETRTVNSQPHLGLDQTKFDRPPVQTGQIFGRFIFEGSGATLSIFEHVVGIGLIGK